MSKEDPRMSVPPSERVAREAESWLARLHAPDCSSADRRRFQNWLAQAPVHWQAYNNAEHLWSAAAQAKDPGLTEMADAILSRASQRRRAGLRRPRVFGWAAAVAMVGCCVAVLLSAGWLNPDPAPIIYSTAIGEIRSFTLPDGSVITLNTDTILQVAMKKRARLVALQRGEAQFKVAHDPQRPFTVTTHEAAVTALGTVFQVRNTDGVTEVSLLEGRVQVEPASDSGKNNARRELAPGDRLLARAGLPWVRTAIDAEAASGWLSGRLVFDSVPLHRAVAEFNRYSRRKLLIGDPTLNDVPIEGVFHAGDTNSIALALKYAYDLRIDTRGNEVILRRK